MCQRSRGSRAMKDSAKDHSGSGNSCDQHGSVETWPKHVINSVCERENLQMIRESAGGLTEGDYLWPLREGWTAQVLSSSGLCSRGNFFIQCNLRQLGVQSHAPMFVKGLRGGKDMPSQKL